MLTVSPALEKFLSMKCAMCTYKTLLARIYMPAIFTPIISFNPPNYLEINTIDPLVSMRALRIRETKQLTQQHLANIWKIRD